MGTGLTFQRSFGQFLLLKLIARGGMAEIFRAMAFGSQGFSKLVAVKRILPHLSNDPQYVDMFVQEAKLAANLHHANIVQIYDFGAINNQLYQSMEYIHGKNASEIIQTLILKQQKTSTEHACRILLDTLYGLEHAHQRKDRAGNPLHLMHRDMTPTNVIVSYDGAVKIADFGIAKTAQTTVETSGGIVKGKQKYMSPEQALGQPLDQRTDIFSLGICFYELLTQQDAFTGFSELELLNNVATVRFTPPRTVDPDIPEEIEAMVLKAMAKEPDERFPDASAWRQALERFMVARDIRPGSSWLLGDIMKQLFRDTIRGEQAQIADEARLAEELGPDVMSTATQTEKTGNWHVGTVLTESSKILREQSQVTSAPEPPQGEPVPSHPTPRVVHKYVVPSSKDGDTDRIALEDKPTLQAMPTFQEEPAEEDIPLGERPTFREMPAFEGEPEPEDEEE